MISRMVLLLLMCALTAPLSACGKKGPNEPPPGKESTYPKQYPK